MFNKNKDMWGISLKFLRGQLRYSQWMPGTSYPFFEEQPTTQSCSLSFDRPEETQWCCR